MTEYTRDFATWQEALPFALGVARKVARRSPLMLDVDSLVMEALWMAQTRGAVLSRGYVHLRITGAVKDEMRKVAFLGSRRAGYVSGSHIADAGDIQLAAEALDVDSTIDAVEALRANLSDRDRQIVIETFAQGRRQRDVALDLGVSETRVSQLLTRATRTMRDHLERQRDIAPPVSVQVPVTPEFRVRDFRRELWLARRNALYQRMTPGMSMRGLATALALPEVTVLNWCNSTTLGYVLLDRSDAISDAVRERGKQLIVAALRARGGSGMQAAPLLRLSNSTLCKWRNRLIPEAPTCPSGTPSRVDPAVLAQLRAGRLSHRQIGRVVGLSAPAVGAALAKLGLSGGDPRRRVDVSMGECSRLRADGLTHRQMAQRLACSTHLVRKRLHEARSNVGPC